MPLDVVRLKVSFSRALLVRLHHDESRKNIAHDSVTDIGQLKVATGVALGERFVVAPTFQAASRADNADRILDR